MRISSLLSTKLSRLQAPPSVALDQSILVVEDTRPVRLLLCAHLRELGGFEIEQAGSMAEALATINGHPERFFAAALDLGLPDAPNGEIVDAIQKLGIPSIVLTGTSDAAIRKAVMMKNVIDYVIKGTNHQIEHIAYLIGRLRENKTMKVLVVDSSNDYRDYLCGLLDRYFYRTLQALDGVEALDILDEHPDLALVITDVDMPRLDGIGLIEEIRKCHRREDMAIIGLSDSAQPGLSAKILKAGANDVLSKSFEQEEFYCRVTQNTNMVGYIRQRNAAADRDLLTGAYNRRQLYDIGEVLHAVAQRGDIRIAAGVIDIDQFKTINTTHGHNAGDTMLKALATTLGSALTKSDIIARCGGEEFACLAVVKDAADARTIFEHVRKALEDTRVTAQQGVISVTASIGVTTTPESSFEGMLRKADDALTAAKAAGGNCVVVR